MEKDKIQEQTLDEKEIAEELNDDDLDQVQGGLGLRDVFKTPTKDIDSDMQQRF